MFDTQHKTGNGSGIALEPIRGTRGASILGPRNVPLENENASLLLSPETDAGTVPNLKFSYAGARNRIAAAGGAREVTVRELPISKHIAAVNMRLQPGGIRELHWHKEAEWGYMLAGQARVTAIDPRAATSSMKSGPATCGTSPRA